MNGIEIADIIEGNPVLSKLRASSRARLLASAKFRQVDPGAVICHQETRAARFWLLHRGEIKLVKYTNGGASSLIDIVLPGELIGMVFCRDHQVYPCTAVAMKRSELISFSLKTFSGELEKNPQVQGILLTQACSKLCHALERQAHWREGALARTAHSLLYLYEKFGRNIPHTRATLAEMSGTSVETAIRLTSILTRDGSLATGRGRMEILSLTDLRASAHSGSMSQVIEE